MPTLALGRSEYLLVRLVTAGRSQLVYMVLCLMVTSFCF